MRIPVLVQNSRTRKYLKKDGHWTTWGSQAAVFHSARTAIEFCLQKEVQDVELIYRFEGFDRDISVPLALQAAKNSRGRSSLD